MTEAINFGVYRIGDPEDSSVAVRRSDDGRTLIVSDTGNGGDTAYCVLMPQHGTSECEEIKPWPAFTYNSVDVGINAAKILLTCDIGLLPKPEVKVLGEVVHENTAYMVVEFPPEILSADYNISWWVNAKFKYGDVHEGVGVIEEVSFRMITGAHDDNEPTVVVVIVKGGGK